MILLDHMQLSILQPSQLLTCMCTYLPSVSIKHIDLLCTSLEKYA